MNPLHVEPFRQPAQVLQPFQRSRVGGVVPVRHIEGDRPGTQCCATEVGDVEVAHINIAVEVENANERRSGIILGIQVNLGGGRNTPERPNHR